MIRDRTLWEQWQKKQLREESLDFSRNLRIFEALYEEACALGAFPLQNPLEGLEAKIRMVKVVNVS